MFLYPKDYFESVKDITIDYLNDHKIKALILDVDNTLIDYFIINDKGCFNNNIVRRLMYGSGYSN